MSHECDGRDVARISRTITCPGSLETACDFAIVFFFLSIALLTQATSGIRAPVEDVLFER